MRESEAHRFNQGIWSQGGKSKCSQNIILLCQGKKKQNKNKGIFPSSASEQSGEYMFRERIAKNCHTPLEIVISSMFHTFRFPLSLSSEKKTVQSMEFSYFLCISLFTLKIFRSYRFINNFTIAKAYNTAPPFITLLTKLHFSNSKTVLEIPFVPCWSSLITPKEVRW